MFQNVQCTWGDHRPLGIFTSFCICSVWRCWCLDSACPRPCHRVLSWGASRPHGNLMQIRFRCAYPPTGLSKTPSSEIRAGSDALSCWPWCSARSTYDMGTWLPGKSRRTVNLEVLFLGCLDSFSREQRRDAAGSLQIHTLEPNPRGWCWGLWAGFGVRGGPGGGTRRPMGNRGYFSLSDLLVQLPSSGRQRAPPCLPCLPPGASPPRLSKAKASFLVRQRAAQLCSPGSRLVTQKSTESINKTASSLATWGQVLLVFRPLL